MNGASVTDCDTNYHGSATKKPDTPQRAYSRIHRWVRCTQVVRHQTWPGRLVPHATRAGHAQGHGAQHGDAPQGDAALATAFAAHCLTRVLQERSRNKLRDYLTLAPALKVSHLLAFTLTAVAPSLRIVRLPAGPTFSFRIERYSLVKDVLSASRRPRSVGAEYLSPPLVRTLPLPPARALTAPQLVLSAFPAPSATTPPHLPLLAKALQALFPALAPRTLALPAARRVVLVAHDAARGTLDVRHYVVAVRAHGVARRVRRAVAARAAPDLGRHRDVADFVLRARRGGESASEGASSAGEEDAVELPADYVGRNNEKGARRAVRLDEVGPRMELRLVKIVEGVPGKEGAVIYHQFGGCVRCCVGLSLMRALVTKSRTEEARQRADHAAKERLRKLRREEQEANVRRKKMDARKDGEEVEEEGEDDDGAWDDEEEISEGGEGSGDEGVDESSESETLAPPKRRKG